MVDNDRMGSGGAQQAYKWRNTEIRTEIKMQGIELYKKIEELQLQMDTVIFHSEQRQNYLCGVGVVLCRMRKRLSCILKRHNYMRIRKAKSLKNLGVSWAISIEKKGEIT